MMSMILSPWVYLPLHVGHSFPLSKWLGSSTGGSIGQIVILIFNITLYIAEHWTRSFPNLSRFVYDANIHDLSTIMMLSFFYFSYHNCGNNKSLVKNWFFATLAYMFIAYTFDLGFPKSTVEEQLKYIEEDSLYNISHFVGHCFLFVMAWHVASVVDVSNGLERGWLVRKAEEMWKKVNEGGWNPTSTLLFSLAACGLTSIIAVAIEFLKVALASDSSVPLWPPFCRATVTNADRCTFLGITIPCHKLFNEDVVNHFGLGLEQTHLWTFFTTFTIGLVALYGTGLDWQSSSLKISCALYGIETSLFALIRYYWGVCKPLVAAAAVHNLCEWSIILHIACSYKTLRKYLPLATFFIVFLVTLCLCIPDLFLSLAMEQSFGIMVDFGMPIMFTMQLFDKDRRKIYLIPAIAHTVHLFGTILPLVFSILFSNHLSWFCTFFLEIIINVTVPTAHFLYCYWSYNIDRELGMISSDSHEPPGTESDAPSVVGSDLSGSDHATTNEDMKEEAPSAPRSVSEFSPSLQDAAANEGPLPVKYRIQGVERYFFLGFLLGLFVLAYIPLMYMPVCDAPPCVLKKYVSKTSILTVNKTYVGESQGMLESGGTTKEMLQAQPGLIELNVGRVRHEVAADKFFMVEQWKSKENMTDDILSRFINTSLGKALVDEAPEQLAVASVNSMTCSTERIATIEVKPEYSCKKLWRVISSPGYCTWAPGCKFITADSAGHAMHMEDGTIQMAAVAKEWKEMKLSVSVLSDTHLPGYSGVMTLENPGKRPFPWSNSNKSCKLKYEFRINVAYLSTPSLCSDYFNEYFLPDLYTRLSRE